MNAQTHEEYKITTGDWRSLQIALNLIANRCLVIEQLLEVLDKRLEVLDKRIAKLEAN